jgi:hypothetical protein
MKIPLQYEDYHPDTKQPKQVRFESVCPRSSNIVKRQSGILAHPGLTVVALVEDNNFLKYLGKLQKTNCGFTRVQKLHCTLLGLLGGKDSVNSNLAFKKLIYDSVKEFIDQQKPGALQIKFNLIRPGTWRIGENKNLVNNCSDGTVIATGKMEEADNKRFCDLGESLAEYLKTKLDYIFGPDFKRKYPSLWCTLGYFDCADFDICDIPELSDLFSNLKDMNITLNIDQLSMLEFCSRTLEWSNRYRDPITL